MTVTPGHESNKPKPADPIQQAYRRSPRRSILLRGEYTERGRSNCYSTAESGRGARCRWTPARLFHIVVTGRCWDERRSDEPRGRRR